MKDEVVKQETAKQETGLVIATETVEALDRAAKNGMLAQNEVSQFKRAALVAASMQELRNLLTPRVLSPFLALQNSRIGFRTDNKAGYPPDVVRDCLIEATLKGVYPVGNEFNIIAGQCYITKEGYYHKLRDIPNFSWVEVPGIPHINSGNSGAVIKVALEWLFRGGPKSEKELELCIRVNSGMGTDAIIGKAIRKARAWLYTTVTGQDVGDGEVDATDMINVTPEAQKSPFEEEPSGAKEPESGNELPM